MGRGGGLQTKTPAPRATVKIDRSGVRFYYNTDGKLDRQDAPAVEIPDQASYWDCESDCQYQGPASLYLRNGVFHRADGPAIESPNQHIEVWYQDGVLHREGGPAVSVAEGSSWEDPSDSFIYDGPVEIYVRDGQFHRDGGPAVKYEHGTEAWYQEGKLHRLGGPAMTEVHQGTPVGARSWYWQGKIHSAVGPAYELMTSTGLPSREFHLFGEPYHSEQGWRAAIERAKEDLSAVNSERRRFILAEEAIFHEQRDAQPGPNS